jgi:ubiquinone biosynthesis protein Coq4
MTEMTLRDRLRSVRAGVTLLRDPSRLEMVFELDRAMTNKERADEVVAHAKQHPRCRAAIAAGRRLRVDLPALRALPIGALGRSYADFLDTRGLDPRSIPSLTASDDAEWVHAHLYETHDVWHVATGFATDIAGEVGLQAFYAAQLPGGRLSPLLVTGGLLQSVFWAPADYGNRLSSIARGYALGKKAEPLLGVAWDDHWEEPLDAVRLRLRLLDD